MSSATSNLSDSSSSSNQSYSYYDYYADAPYDRQTYRIIMGVCRVAVVAIISSSGLVTNVINMVVFVRQGLLADSCTLCLAGLSLSDFFVCFHTLWGTICVLLMNEFDISSFKWDVGIVATYTSMKPRTLFAHIGCWITAFVAFERCFSVMFPFKVKTVFTPKRSLVVLCCIFIVTFAYHIPILFYEIPTMYRVEWANKTVFTYSMPIFPRETHFYLDIVCSIILRVTAIIIVLLCNIVMVWKVTLSRKFREKVTLPHTTTITTTSIPDTTGASDQGDNKTPKDGKANAKVVTKEAKLLRMITIVCTLFFFCYIPDTLHVSIFYTHLLEPPHIYIDRLFTTVATMTESLNASCNIIIYYTMSTRYRQEFSLLCCKRKT